MPSKQADVKMAASSVDARAQRPRSVAHAATRKDGEGRKKVRVAEAQRRRRVWGDVVLERALRRVLVLVRLLKSSMSWRWMGRRRSSSVGRRRRGLVWAGDIVDIVMMIRSMLQGQNRL